MGAPEPKVNAERILDTLQAFQRTEALRAAIELDLFTALAEGLDEPETLAGRAGASPRGLRALLRYLVTIGLVVKEGDRYAPAPDAARYLDRRSPAYLGDTARFYTAPALREGFADLTEAVRRGGSDPRRIDSMQPEHPVWVDYATAMASVFRGAAESLADLLMPLEPPPRTILDVAAGHGLFGIALLRRLPEAAVTALDWAPVLPVAAAHARAAGVLERFRTHAGSAFDAELRGPYDTVLVANFVHHFPPRRVVELLERLRGALVPGGRIVLVEFVANDDLVTPTAAGRFALTMLATTPGGDAYTFAELSDLLLEAGFDGPVLRPLAHSPERAVLARRTEPGGGRPLPDVPYKNI